MKNIKTLILVGLTLLLGLSSCATTQEKVQVADLSLSLKSVTLDAAGTQSATVIVTTTSKWTATANPSWIKIDQPEGTGRQVIKITADPNPLAKDRRGTVSFLPWGCTTGATVVAVTQKAGSADLIITPSGNEALKLVYAYDETAKDDNKFFLVQTNSAWTLEPAVGLTVFGDVQGGASTPAEGTKVYVFPSAPNTLAKAVTFPVAFAAQGQTLEFLVEQGPAPVAIATPAPADAKLDFSCLAEALSFNYSVNVDADKIVAKLMDTGDGIDWVSFATPGASATEVSVTENTATKSRSCKMKLTFTGEGPMNVATLMVTITQDKAGNIASLSHDVLIFTGEGGTQKVELTTNPDARWNLLSSTIEGTKFFKPDVNYGTGSQEVTFTTGKNDDTEEPISYNEAFLITFADGSIAILPLRINQEPAAATLSANNTQFVIEAEGKDNIEVTFDTNIDLTDPTNVEVSKNAGWITPTNISNGIALGVSDFTLTFSVNPNKTVSERTATINVTAGPEGNRATMQLTVIQKAAAAVAINSVSPTKLVFNPKKDAVGKEVKIAVQNAKTTEWSIIPPEAVPYFAVADAGNGYLLVTTLQDNTVKERVGTLEIRAEGEGNGDIQTANVSLTQLFGTDELTLTPATFAAKAIGNPHVTVQVTTSATDGWSVVLVEPDNEWITISSASDDYTATTASGASGDDVTFTLSNNTTAYERNATIRVNAGTAYQYLQITQEAGKTPTVEVYNNNALLEGPLTIPAVKAAKALVVKSNTVWEARIIGAGEEPWIGFGAHGGLPLDPIISAEAGNTDLELMFDPNPNAEVRSCEIVFTAGEGAYTSVTKVLVKQEGAAAATLEVENNQIDFSAAAETRAIVVTSNTDWTAVVLEGGDWLSLGELPTATGNGSGSFDLSASEYEQYTLPRTGKVRIMAGNSSNRKVVVLTVVQAPCKPITLNPTSLLFNALNFDVKTVRVIADENAAWTAVPSDDWIEIVGAEDEYVGPQDLQIGVDLNFAKEARTGKITFTNQNGLDKTELTITQKAAEPVVFTLSQNMIAVNGRAQEVTLPTNTIQIAAEYAGLDIVSSVDWLDVTFDEILNCEIAIMANTTGAPREGVITITMGSVEYNNYATAEVTVKQAAQTMTVTPQRIEVDGAANTALITVEGTIQSLEAVAAFTPNAATLCDWITIEGENPYTVESIDGYSTVLSIAIGENTTNQERFADIAINGGGRSSFVRVIQQPHTLTLSGTGSFNALATTRSIAVSSTEEWEAQVYSLTSTNEALNEEVREWLHVDNDAVVGENNGYVRLILDDNTTGITRQGVLVVTTPTRSASLIITQTATNENFWTTLGVGYVSKIAVEQNGFMDLMLFDAGDLNAAFGEIPALTWGHYWPNIGKTNPLHYNRSKEITIYTPEDLTFTGYRVELLGVNYNEIVTVDNVITTVEPWVEIEGADPSNAMILEKINVGTGLHEASFTLMAADNSGEPGTENTDAYPFLYGPRMAVLKVTLMGTNSEVAPQYFLLGHQADQLDPRLEDLD